MRKHLYDNKIYIIMAIIRIKPVCLALILALALVFTLPGIAAASMQMNAGLETDSCRDAPAVPICCLTGDCMVFQCILTDTAIGKYVHFTRSLPVEEICLQSPITGPADDIESEPNLSSQPELVPKSPSETLSEYHCRNSLSAEDPVSL